jgi:hypothetical protein
MANLKLAKSTKASRKGLITKSTNSMKKVAFIDDRGDVGLQLEGLRACREYLDEYQRERRESLIANDYSSHVELERRKMACV